MRQAKLQTRLRRARILLRDWQRAIREGCAEKTGPHVGVVTDELLIAEFKNFQEAQSAIIEATMLLNGDPAKLALLVLELADAVENAADDIGGSRPQLDILREAV